MTNRVFNVCHRGVAGDEYCNIHHHDTRCTSVSSACDSRVPHPRKLESVHEALGKTGWMERRGLGLVGPGGGRMDGQRWDGGGRRLCRSDLCIPRKIGAEVSLRCNTRKDSLTLAAEVFYNAAGFAKLCS